MEYLSQVRVLDTDYKLMDEEAARINHTHKTSDIEDIQQELDSKADSSHTHANATTNAAGYMSATDKKKLDGIEDGANAYELPMASVSEIGGLYSYDVDSDTGVPDADKSGGFYTAVNAFVLNYYMQQANTALSAKADSSDVYTKSETDAKLAEKSDTNHTHDGLIPSGGTTGQVLAKASNTDKDVTWIDASSGGSLLKAYPVGSLYFNASDATNPAELFGFGTWERFGEGRMMLSASDSHAAGTTGGEEKHTLTTSEMPKHLHHTNSYQDGYPTAFTGKGTWYTLVYNKTKGNNTNESPITSNTGGSAAHNNMPPYVSVYVWVRTA